MGEEGDVVAEADQRRLRGAPPASRHCPAATARRGLRWCALAWALSLVAPLAAHASSGPPSTPASSAPSCVAGNDSRSMAVAKGALTVSPEPGTVDATPSTQISLLGLPVRDISHVQVRGSRTGVHAGRLDAYSQGDGGSFLPDAPFAEGERVAVSLQVRDGGAQQRVEWHFTVGYRAGLGAAHFNHPKVRTPAPAEQRSKRAVTAAEAKERPGPLGPNASVPRRETLTQHFHSAPSLHPPRVIVSKHADSDAPGLLFMSPFSVGQAGPMIINDEGQLVWFDPVNVGPTAATKATNLQVQTYEGKPVLTWWEDPLASGGNGRREPQDVIVNSRYERVATIHGGNGLMPDVHEMQLTPEGTALIAENHDVRCNLTSVKGSADGSVWDDVIQEIDVATGLVRWEWNSLDHVPLRAAYDSALVASASYPFDFFHLNSIQQLEGGESLLISARNTWAIYDINHHTGAIRWQLGGKHSTFAMGPGTRTAWQHDARVVARPDRSELEITVFDDGATPRVHRQSRGLIEVVDLASRTARLLRALVNSPPLLAGSQGSVELMSDGDVVVGWGQEPWVTEYGPGGEIRFQAHLPFFEQSYRVLRFEWHGMPSTPPSLALERLPSGRLAVYASWNGATEVASWAVLEADGPAPMSRIATAPEQGFETRIVLPAPVSGSAFAVQALSAEGSVLGTSRSLALPAAAAAPASESTAAPAAGR